MRKVDVKGNIKKTVAIIGSGPAALMCAQVVASAGLAVHLFEKKKGPGRKFLIAGSSGLNVTYDAPLDEFASFYRGPIKPYLEAFPPQDWLDFIGNLGQKTFRGTSRRYFVEGLKASGLLRAWLKELDRLGACIEYDMELVDFQAGPRVQLKFSSGRTFEADAVCLALGGGSWEPGETPLRWPAILKTKGIGFRDFEPSNVGYEVAWKPEFLKVAEGKPLKNVELQIDGQRKRGDLVVTRYGLEGTPIYFFARPGEIKIDLKPDLTLPRLVDKLQNVKENRAPLWRVKKLLNLPPASLALLEYEIPRAQTQNLEEVAALIKGFPLTLKGPRPLQEAISSKGGLKWNEIETSLMLKKAPNLYAAGEMLDWDAPTGGFLIQGCVSLGHYAGKSILAALKS